jgi:HEAT repeat protein
VSGAARALKIHPGEARLAASMIALSFLVMSGQAIGQSGVTGLVLARIGTESLPVLYLLQGAAAIALMLVMASVLGRVDQRRAYLFMAAALVVVVIVERIALAADPGWIYWVLWVTVTIAILVQTVFVWGIAGTVTDTRQAKRLFPLFAAGGILGSVIGGLLTAPLAQIIGTPNTMVIWVATLIGAYGLAWLVLRERPARSAAPHGRAGTSALRDLAGVFRYVARSRLLVWMTIAAVLFSVLFFSLFLPWASAAADRFPRAEDLAGFIGLFSAITTAAAFLVSSVATNRLFTRIGIATAVMILPVLYVGAFGVLLASASFATLVAGRALTGIWLQGVASPGWETLTNVVPETRRDQVRAFLNGGPSQAGTAIAGLIALVGTDVLSPRQLTIVGLATAIGTVFVTWRCKRAYASALVEALQAGRPVFSGDATLTVPFELAPDAQALDSAIEATADPSPSVRRLAVGLVGDVHEERVRRVLDRALDDDDPVVAALAASFLCDGSGPDLPSRLRTFVTDPDPAVRAGAVTALEHAPATVAEPLALAALGDEEPSVRAAAIRTLARAAPARAVEATERALQDPSPRVRHAAAEAGARIGEAALRPMLAALTRPAARDAALEALAQLSLFDGAVDVRAFATDRAAEANRDRELADAIVGDGDPADLLREALLDRGRGYGREALRAMSLLSPDGPAVRAAIEQLDVRTGAQIATALEMLESTDERALVRPMLALWDRSEAQAQTASGGDPLRAILDDPDPFIAMCAELLHVTSEGGSDMARVHATMPMMERVLFLRKVALFQELAPADLMPIAEVADEQTFVAGDLLGDEGERGDGLHVIVAGTVRVETGGTEIARRGTGDVVGEMSLITMHPRMASLRADGDVRTIWISRRAFEGMLHDRPDIAIGVMRVLALRLAER